MTRLPLVFHLGRSPSSPAPGWDGLQIQQAVADVVAEDPVGCARFMETTHRPTQAVPVGAWGGRSAEGECVGLGTQQLVANSRMK